MMAGKEPFAQRLIGWFGWSTDGVAADSYAETLIMPESELSETMVIDVDDRYESVKTLGKGAYGTVTLAKDRQIGRLIAIKRLNADYRGNSTVYKHFLQEARIAGQLENPHIVTIYDVCDGQSPCILMEFLGGGNLERVIRDDAPLPEVEALNLLQAIMVGLKDAHAIGVVHRDIKPSNILFDQSGTPKVSDFGVALMPAEAGGVDDEDSRSTYVVGTPDYMSPEQLKPNVSTVDHRADIYACGLMLFEMLTGERHQSLGKTHSQRELVEKISAQSLPEDRDFPPDVSPSTRDLVRSMIRSEPGRRPASVDDVLEDISKIIQTHLGQEDIKSLDREEITVRTEMFADILRLFLVDGVISAAERRELTVRSRRLGISPNDAIKLEETVRREFNLPAVRDLQRYARKAETLLGDRNLSVEDRQILDELGNSLNISGAERRKIEENIMVKYQMKEGHVEDLIP